MTNENYKPRIIDSKIQNFLKIFGAVFIEGPKCCGKTWLASALATNAIMKDSFRAFYIRTPELFSALTRANVLGSREKLINKLIKIPLLIIDEFLIRDITQEQQGILLDIFEYRYGKASTIICSQYPMVAWHERLGGDVIADSILDRITTTSYVMEIEGNVSMRRRHEILD